MSYDASAKKPLAEVDAGAGASVGTDAHPAVGGAGPEEAKQPSASTIQSMAIETPQRTPQQSPQQNAERRPSNWSGSFGGPSERVGNYRVTSAGRGFMAYLRGLCRDFIAYLISLYREPTMDKFTDLAVTVSTIPFLFIQIPQIVSNFNEPEEIPKAWTGLVSGGMGNLLLCTFFSDGGEWAQARVQAIGAITNIFVVAQAYFLPTSPAVPLVPFLAVMLIMIAGLIIPLLKALGKGEKVFAAWLKGTTIIGMTVLFFALTYSIMDDGGALFNDSGHVSRTCAPQPKGAKKEDVNVGPGLLIPGLVSLAGLVLSSLMVFFDYTTSSTGGILATMLFMYMPVPQLFKNLVNAADATGFNMGFVYFGTLGNGLGLSRALYTRNFVWLAGSSWGCFVGGVIMTLTVLIANGNCDVSFLSGTEVILAIIFSAVFLVYAVALFYCTLAWDLRPKPPSQRELRLP